MLIALKRFFRHDQGGMMKKVYMFFLSLILIGLVGEVWAVPPFPHTFYGIVKKDGINVPDGTVIGAWIGGVQYDSTTTSTFGVDSVYTLNVLGDDPETLGKEGGVSGDTVSFTIGSDPADQNALFLSGNITNLPLTTVTKVSIAVAWNPAEDQFQIAVRGVNNGIYLGTATANGVFNNDWTQILSGSTSAVPAIAWNPAAGRVQIAVKGLTSNSIYVGNVSADGTGFSGWTQIPSSNTSTAPAIVWNPVAGKVQIAVKGNTTNSIYVGNVSADGTVFSGWTLVAGGVSADSPAIAIGSVAGMLNIFARDPANSIVGYAVPY
jgi:hypothetical protein